MKEREVEVVLFGAENSGDLKREYPGLADIEEFKDLSTHELRFCWLVGNRTSPIFQMERFERMDRAMRIVWGQHYRTNSKIKELVDSKGQEDIIPEHILKGIYKMNTFNPAYRLKAKLMAEYIFEALNELIVLPQADLRTMDIDDRKKYS